MTESAGRARLIEKLKWLRSFVVYARYELQPGASQVGDQFPRQADADRALSEIDAIAEALAGQEEAQDMDDPIHTGDDDLLDALTGARTALESIADDPDVDRDEAIQDALDELTTADGLRVAELKAAKAEEDAPAPPRQTVEKFVAWVKRTPNSSLTGNSRVAYDAQMRVLDQLVSYLEGKDEYLDILVDPPAPRETREEPR